jgi:hypothetical protein
MAKSAKPVTIANRLREITVARQALDLEETKLKQELADSTRTFLQEITAFLDPTAE